MEHSEPLKGSAVVAELAKLARLLRDPETRKSFMGDSKAALQGGGVEMSAIPTSVLDTLSGMSHDELAAVIRFNDALVDAGLYVEAEGGYGKPDAGVVGFF
jgi:hypothetical protein